MNGMNIINVNIPEYTVLILNETTVVSLHRRTTLIETAYSCIYVHYRLFHVDLHHLCYNVWANSRTNINARLAVVANSFADIAHVNARTLSFCIRKLGILKFTEYDVFSWKSTEVLEVWRAELGYEWTLEHALGTITQFLKWLLKSQIMIVM